MTAAERFAAHALETRFEDLSPLAVESAKTFILDSFGVGIAGSSAAGADGLLAVARTWGTQPQAQVWGRSNRLSAPAAAFMNAWQMHNQEYDCLHEGAVVHALASVLPAALAAAEASGGCSGRNLITAIAIGTDIAAGLGLASRAGFRFFRPATAGGFGAVAAAGRILGLDQARMEAAFAWQLAQASGTMQAHKEGSPILAVQIGFNARAALQSCELSLVGLPPSHEVFEGPYGYLSVFEDAFDLQPVLRDLGRVWRIVEFSHKPYPAGRATHGGVEGVLALREEYGFAIDDVAEIAVSAPPLIVRLVGRPPVVNAGSSYARLCLAFVAATALRKGGVDILDFRDDALNDAATLAIAGRVRLEDDGNPDPNALAPQSVSVRLTKGKSLDWRCDTMLASPRRPLSRLGQLKKFHRCMEFSAESLSNSSAAALISSIEHLEDLVDVRVLSSETAGNHGK
jgi:aconitate decarboxylase